MRFFGGRVSVLPIEQHLFLEPDREARTQHLEAALSRSFEYEGKRKARIAYEPILDARGKLLGGIIGKPAKSRLPTREDGHFLKRQAELWPHVYCIYIGSQNLLMIQRDLNVFRKPLILLENLANYLSSQLFNVGLTVHIAPLTMRGRFWEVQEQLESIQEVNLRFVAPNFLGEFHKETKEMLAGIVAETNADEVGHSLYSSAGKLHVPDTEGYKSAIEWIESGGGEWSIIGRTQGSRVKRKSGSSLRLVTTELEISDPTPEQIRAVADVLALAIREDPKGDSTS